MTFEALASSNVGTWEWDIGRDAVRCSAVTASLFALPPGKAAGELPLRRFVEAIYPEDRGRFQRLIEASRQHGGEFLAEYRTMSGPGQLSCVLARGRFQKDTSGMARSARGVVIEMAGKHAESCEESSPSQPQGSGGDPLQDVADHVLAAWDAGETLAPESFEKLKPLFQALLLGIGREVAVSLGDDQIRMEVYKRGRMH